MSLTDDLNSYDLSAIVVRPLYFGMGVNIIAPAAVLLICYYLNENHYMENRLGDLANTVFYVFAGLAMVQAGIALWLRQKAFERPMIKSEATLQQDIADELAAATRPIFVLIAAISLWGFVYFFLTGRFQEALVFVVGSFLVFQVVRPRVGSARKLVQAQKELFDRGSGPGGFSEQ